MCANVPVSFWKAIDNNNRSAERQIGKLKNIIQKRLNDGCNRRVDMRLRAFLCNMNMS